MRAVTHSSPALLGPSLVALLSLLACAEPPPPTDAFDVPGPDWSAPVDPTPAPTSQLPRLQTRGAELVTSHDGAPIRLRGVNVCSLEFDATGRNWELGETGSALLATLADPLRWNVNVVRMPVNQQWFVEDDAYVARIERLIDDADRRGVYVILDVQWEQGRALEPYHDNILELPTFGFGNTTEAFWHRAVGRWSNRTNLLYDLINEPHDQPPERTAAAMQAMVDRIHSRQPDAVIVIGGMGWAHSLDYYRTRPLSGPNLVYSAHQYLPHDRPEKLLFNFQLAAQSLPVLLGEFLASDEPVLGRPWANLLVEQAEASGVDGWMPWAIGCGFGKEDDTLREPLISLARTMRELNQ